MSENQKALAKRSPIHGLTMKFPEDEYNILAPTVHMDGGLPAGTRLVVTEVKINPDASRTGPKEVFPLPGGALLVGKPGLDKIANAAGVSWDNEERKDPRNHPHYVEAFVAGTITDFDGSTRKITGSKTVDLRQDAGGGIPGKDYDEITTKNKSPDRQLMEARKFIAEIAFSKAKNRAIASALGIKRSYTADELKKPFIIPKLALDTSDPAARELAMANAAGATAAMYGAKAADVVEAEFEEAAVAPTEDAPPSPMEPPSMDEPHDQETGEVRDTRPAPTKDEIKDRTGAAYRRIKSEHAAFSDKAWRSLIRNATGAEGYKDLSWHDLEAITLAAEDYVQSLGS